MGPIAQIFDVKHYAVHDGPGIRTTFFLLGCPLNCLWCQNPESQSASPVITFSPMKCIGCGSCTAVCQKLGSTLTLPMSLCTRCGACVSACPTGARRHGSTAYTPEMILNTVLPERIFYDASGGGVTFSGGECLTQAAFVEATFRLLHENGIHTTVDTCGAIAWDSLARVLPHTDVFLYDIKKIDSTLHKAYTGLGSELILNNLKKLCDAGAAVIIRIPLIPGYTDSDDDMAKIGTFIRDVLHNRIVRCELLPYNKLAGSKYGNKTIWSDYSLGEYPLPELEPQTSSYIAKCSEILRHYGVNVFSESL